MENLGAMAYSRYTGFREITDRDVLELHCNIFEHSLKFHYCLHPTIPDVTVAYSLKVDIWSTFQDLTPITSSRGK